MKHQGTKTIQTENLILRKIELSDANNFYKLITDEKVLEYLAGIPKYTGVDMEISYICEKLSIKYKNDNFYDWGIALKNDKLIGRITVYKLDEEKRMADLVWFINKDYRGKGYTTEAAQVVVKFLQDIGFERIEAFADVDNIASQRVMEKAGFTYEGTLRKYDLRRDGSLYDAKMYSIIKEN